MTVDDSATFCAKVSGNGLMTRSSSHYYGCVRNEGEAFQNVYELLNLLKLQHCIVGSPCLIIS